MGTLHIGVLNWGQARVRPFFRAKNEALTPALRASESERRTHDGKDQGRSHGAQERDRSKRLPARLPARGADHGGLRLRP